MKSTRRLCAGWIIIPARVFEFVTDELGAQGGRLRGRALRRIGGVYGRPSMPSLGFGMGLERVIALMEKQGCSLPTEQTLRSLHSAARPRIGGGRPTGFAPVCVPRASALRPIWPAGD